jgi:hypothetical protein
VARISGRAFSRNEYHAIVIRMDGWGDGNRISVEICYRLLFRSHFFNYTHEVSPHELSWTPATGETAKVIATDIQHQERLIFLVSVLGRRVSPRRPNGAKYTNFCKRNQYDFLTIFNSLIFGIMGNNERMIEMEKLKQLLKAYISGGSIPCYWIYIGLTKKRAMDLHSTALYLSRL